MTNYYNQNNEIIIKNIDDDFNNQYGNNYINIDDYIPNKNNLNFNDILNKIKELFKDYDNNTLNNDEVIRKIVDNVLNNKNIENDSLKNKSILITQLIQNFFKQRNINYENNLHNTATLFFIIKNVKNEKKERKKLTTENLIITKELFLSLYKYYYNKRYDHTEKKRMLILNTIYDIVYTYIEQIEKNNKRNLKISKIEKIYILKNTFVKILGAIDQSKFERNIEINNLIMLINYTYPLIEFYDSASNRSINIDISNSLYLTQILLQFSSSLFTNLNMLFKKII